MSENAIYMPILKGKAGEFQALRDLPPSITRRILPLIEVPPLTVDAINETTETLDEHIQKAIRGISSSGWSADEAMLVDTHMVSEELPDAEEAHPLTELIRVGREAGRWLVPVVRLSRDNSYRDAICELISEDSQLCIRVTDEDIELGLNLGEAIHEFVERVGVQPESVHLLFDFREIPADAVGRLALSFNSLLAIVSGIQRWQTVTLAGSSFPRDLSSMERDSSEFIIRGEWRLYRQVRSLVEDQYNVRLVFGDFGVSHPDPPPDIDPRLMRPSASIRYTTSEAWMVLKGTNVRENGFEQFHSLSEQVMRSEEFRGRDFSWGDNYIADCATRQATTGNLTTWRRVGTNHHVAVVVEQLSSHS
jgi:hypothetical protein